jgi:tripartite-type tricarboxylate transporter receptor subunit TctC
MKNVSLALLATLAACPALAADPVADFYRGKQVQIVVGYGAGGGYDLYARLLARHFGDFIPGNPAPPPSGNIYYAQVASGSNNGTNCANAYAYNDGTHGWNTLTAGNTGHICTGNWTGKSASTACSGRWEANRV